jgi:hypothetical protein
MVATRSVTCPGVAGSTFSCARHNYFCVCLVGDKGIAINAHYLSTPGARELGTRIYVIEIQDDIVYRECNLY